MLYGHETHLPAPSADFQRALRLADFADESSMRTLQAEVSRYARALRAANVSQSRVIATVRALVDDALPNRVVPIRTSEGRTQLLALVAAWSGDPTT